MIASCKVFGASMNHVCPDSMVSQVNNYPKLGRTSSEYGASVVWPFTRALNQPPSIDTGVASARTSVNDRCESIQIKGRLPRPPTWTDRAACRQRLLAVPQLGAKLRVFAFWQSM